MDYADAVSVLRLCATPNGLKASGDPTGHHQIWARDSMITLLGARFARDERIDEALLAGIALLKSRQTTAGAIPNNVDCATLRPNFRAYADAGLWWIIGSSLLAPDLEAAAAVLRWYACQDVDESGLISMQESADWQDLFCTRGKGLYLNCLFVMALRAAGRHEQADAVAGRINHFFWYRGDEEMLRHISHSFSTEYVNMFDSLGRRRWLPAKRHLREGGYYLPYLGFRAVGDWFDTLGNLLAILSGVADEIRTAAILDLIEREGMANSPIRSLTPPVRPGDSDWRDYYGALNQPDCYHNGGIWPFIGGFYVAALVRAGRLGSASAALEKLGALNRAGGFNEWHHGQSLQPMGVRNQAWSAGMYLFACECVRAGRTPSAFFGERESPDAAASAYKGAASASETTAARS